METRLNNSTRPAVNTCVCLCVCDWDARMIYKQRVEFNYAATESLRLRLKLDISTHLKHSFPERETPYDICSPSTSKEMLPNSTNKLKGTKNIAKSTGE